LKRDGHLKPIILITGGGRGIGAATAKLAAQRGYAVCVNYLRDQASAEAIAEEIRANAGRALAIQGDVSTETGVKSLFERMDREMGTLTALVNNAGMLEKQMRVDEMDAGRLSRVFQVNVTGSFLCAREAVRRMSTRHGGRGGTIVNISSAASRLGSPGEYVDYAAAKAAIDTFTIGLAKEVAEEGIRVNAVRPGVIYTTIHASGGEPNRVNRVKNSVPLKRGGHPEEVARAVLWLSSDESSYTTGAFIDVSGGR
jgi:NAD(P)-dependent dehydrogenase (short-subunit alcohol dehydrogenase family)